MDIKERFIHRDVSWLNFNQRVLEEATDTSNPLLERIRFLAIFANNLDEFFMVRVAGIKRLVDSGYNQKDSFGYYPQDVLSELQAKIELLGKNLYDTHKNKITKELQKQKIFIKKFSELDGEQQKFAKKFFDKTVFPVLTPLGVDQGRPFPTLPSKTLGFAVVVLRKDEPRLAIIPVPKNIPRLLKVPSEGEDNFILIDELIREHLANFFKGWKIVGSTLFRLIRDSELSGEEYTSDLLKAIEDELKKRPTAKVVRLEVEKDCEQKFLETLCFELDCPKEEVTFVDGDLDLTYLFELAGEANRPALCFSSFPPQKIDYENIFDRINEGDFICHMPYQSFYPTIDLLQTAANDVNVLAIKMTLYRTNEDSAIIKALKEAATKNKQVTVLVEIKARFDEQKNIHWVKELEAAGCHVIYGLAGMKIHSKVALIVRKEEGKIRRYVHLSTGNYNEKTARIYTDIGYFTANEDFAKDISDFFNVLTGFSLPSRWKRIISSPHDLRQYFFELIDNEIDFQKKNKNGLIIAKMNALEDPVLIEKLYEASNAGVKIQLIVRGICSLVPGVAGMSENIEVKSIVGRFLEHSRVYFFNNNGEYRIFLASADWMQRNFDRRLELLFEIYRDDIKDHLKSILQWYWKDAAKSRFLGADRNYQRKAGQENFNVQEFLINHYASA
jgi:polyphosphate kinase